VIERIPPAPEDGRLEDARVVVSGGRGMGGAEAFSGLEKLAGALGGVVGASLAAVDQGWAPPSRQIGLTGRVVSPELYVAVGISGASQHLAGIASGVILAINTNAKAPIFEFAQLGLIGDAKLLVPALISAVQAAPRLMTAEDLLAAEPTRQIQWGVNAAMVDFMYASMTLALLIFAYGIWRRVRVWRLGRPAARFDRPLERLWRMLGEVVGHTRLVRDRAAGIVHWLVFFGIAVLFMATVVVFIQNDLGIGIMHGAFYLYFESLAVDVFGIFATVGFAAFFLRRYVVGVRRLGPERARRRPARGRPPPHPLHGLSARGIAHRRNPRPLGPVVPGRLSGLSPARLALVPGPAGARPRLGLDPSCRTLAHGAGAHPIHPPLPYRGGAGQPLLPAPGRARSAERGRLRIRGRDRNPDRARADLEAAHGPGCLRGLRPL